MIKYYEKQKAGSIYLFKLKDITIVSMKSGNES